MNSGVLLSLACDDYDLVRPLLDGRVNAEGVKLVAQATASIAERQVRMIRDAAFDVCELSVTTYVLARERGLPLTALPVFLLRRFRHGDIYINTSFGIETPQDLIGTRIGGISYQVASNVWARGNLAEHYGVPHGSITWVTEREEEVAFDPPAGLRIERLETGLTLENALLSGSVHALMSPVVPSSIAAGDSRISRLFPDYRDVEAAYFSRSGLFPIMHVLAMKREVVERSPAIAAGVYKAFEDAKALAYARVRNGRSVPLAWIGSVLEEERRALGTDPWAYGLGSGNRKNLETVLRYMREQGMIRRAVSVEELFVSGIT